MELSNSYSRALRLGKYGGTISVRNSSFFGGWGGFEDKLSPPALPVRHFRFDATNHYSVSSDVINDGSHFGSEMHNNGT